ncbi:MULTISPECIES: phosphotransferase enzyme family protein [unclassified Streptomyces]|uniref:phosphotransferase enzyme family protein n=1 Tax=unclassified Streptomyces TaxID=2593676 RepID=UPI000DAF2B8A|nr:MULTISPECIES: phosphotransferase [unclassified Streptomyces]PZT73368.1 aminoglycoside phosphotransferase [Streptomyces sp. AC1-42T]PZT83644.1 aminoglycoside phosphotransferase [Streptomyces sp. AC1-42W]
MSNAEPDVRVVARILPLCYGIIPTAVDAGPAGTATRNFVARDGEGGRWFVKGYPAGTDLAAERRALELGQFARRGRIPVPVVRRALDGGLIAAVDGTAVSVAAFVENAETAEGGLRGDRWAAVGGMVGRLHRTLARHPAGPPRRVPAREVCDVQRARQRLERLLARLTRNRLVSGFPAWAREIAAQRLDALPAVAAMVGELPASLTVQTVHGDLASPNLLLRGQKVAALIDFRPPGHRSPAWELGRIALDPRTVLAAPDWPTGLAEAIVAYRAANPELPADELLAVPRIAVGYLACSAYPLSEAVDAPDGLTPELEAYARNRHAAMNELRDRLTEAEEVLRDRLR